MGFFEVLEGGDGLCDFEVCVGPVDKEGYAGGGVEGAMGVGEVFVFEEVGWDCGVGDGFEVEGDAEAG